MARYSEDNSLDNKNKYVQDYSDDTMYGELEENNFDLSELALNNIDGDQISRVLKGLMENPEIMDQFGMMKNLGGPLELINKLQGPLQFLAQLNGSLEAIGGLNGLGNIAGLFGGLGNNGYRNNNNAHQNNRYNRYPAQYHNRQNRYGHQNRYGYQNRYNQRNHYNSRYQQQRHPVQGPNLLGNLLGGAGDIFLRLFANR